MTVPQFPAPIEMSAETKRAIIDGLKTIIEIFKAKGRLDASANYSSIIHEPRELSRFIKTYHASTDLVGAIVKDASGKPVADLDAALECGCSLMQIQQLLVKTCSRHWLEKENKLEEKTVTETVNKKVLGLFTKTETVSRVTGGGFDERKVRDISKNMAFDWQLPLLPAYNTLNAAQLLEIGDYLACLQSTDAIRDFAKLDQPTIKKAKAVVGDDFPQVLVTKPSALAGMGGWSKEMYQFYRKALGPAAFDFFSRNQAFFMVCASLEKPVIALYGDILSYIDGANLQEMQRLNIDKTDVLLAGMKAAFGPALKPALSHPNFGKEFLRKLVESLQHLSQEKTQMAQSALITCKAIAPQVAAWLQKIKAASTAG